MSRVSINEDVDKFVDEIVRQKNYATYDVEEKRVTKTGDNFLGIIKLLEINGQTKSGETESLSFIVKLCHESDAFRDLFSLHLAYKNEINMYDNVLPKFAKFQEDSSVKNPFVGVAKCFRTSLLIKTEYLLLENLHESGFKMWGRNALLNVSHVEIILKTYARYHALSLALRAKDLETWEQISSTITNYYVPTVKRTKFMAVAAKGMMKLEERLEKEDGKRDIVKIVQKFRSNLEETFLDCCEGGDSAYFVITHGDCWLNNMMFKYGDETRPNVPTDVRLLDFQLSRLASPVMDLSYFIYCCAPKEVFNDLDHYLRIYSDEQRDFLAELGCGADLYPFSRLREEWNRLCLYGVALCFMVLRGVLANRENMVGLEEAAEHGGSVMENFVDQIQDSEEYFVRTEDVIRHCVENKILK